MKKLIATIAVVAALSAPAAANTTGPAGIGGPTGSPADFPTLTAAYDWEETKRFWRCVFTFGGKC